MHPFDFAHPLVLVFSWDYHSFEESGLADTLHSIPAKLVLVTPADVPEATVRMAEPSVVACVLLVSPEAVRDSTFADVVRFCNAQLAARKEFRLFVRLSRMTADELQATAASIPAAANLLDSVQLGKSTGDPAELIGNLRAHLRQLPEILDYLKYEAWKRLGFRLIPLLTIAFMAAFGYGIWRLSSNPQETLRGNLLPWILAGVGVTLYSSFLAICSFGSTLSSGNFFRLGMAVFPIWIINTFPAPGLVANWPYLLTGFFAGMFMDLTRRMWASSKRLEIPIAMPDEVADAGPPLAGHRGWQMLTTAPVLGVEPRVFIGYSRTSPWGSSTAKLLHTAIHGTGTFSFLDADGIPEGTSWRHKLQEAIGKCTVFIALQDAATASRYWPSAELNAAMRSQAYCGLPAIVIVRDATLSKPAADRSDLVSRLLTQQGQIDPEFLRIIEFQPDTPRNLAQGLLNFVPASVVNPTLSVLFNALIAPPRIALAAMGSAGPALILLVALAGVVLRLFGIRLEEWVLAHGLSTAAMIAAGFFFGFAVRLGFASRFELRVAQSQTVFFTHLWATAAFFAVCRSAFPHVTGLTVFITAVVAGFGFLLACDFISTALPASDRYRPPPI